MQEVDCQRLLRLNEQLGPFILPTIGTCLPCCCGCLRPDRLTASKAAEAAVSGGLPWHNASLCRTKIMRYGFRPTDHPNPNYRGVYTALDCSVAQRYAVEVDWMGSAPELFFMCSSTLWMMGLLLCRVLAIFDILVNDDPESSDNGYIQRVWIGGGRLIASYEDPEAEDLELFWEPNDNW